MALKRSGYSNVQPYCQIACPDLVRCALECGAYSCGIVCVQESFMSWLYARVRKVLHILTLTNETVTLNGVPFCPINIKWSSPIVYFYFLHVTPFLSLVVHSFNNLRAFKKPPLHLLFTSIRQAYLHFSNCIGQCDNFVHWIRCEHVGIGVRICRWFACSTIDICDYDGFVQFLLTNRSTIVSPYIFRNFHVFAIFQVVICWKICIFQYI